MPLGVFQPILYNFSCSEQKVVVVRQLVYIQGEIFLYKTYGMLAVPQPLHMQIMDFSLQVPHIQCVM